MIKISVDDKLSTELTALRDRLHDLSPLMQQIAGIMHDAVEENFEQQGRPRWQALKPSTIKRRKRKGYWPGSILQQRGKLAASIIPRSDSTSARVGTNKRYAAIQQFGGTIKQYARSQKVYFNRNKKTGAVGRRFTQKSRSNFSQWATRGDTSIKIPARPFLKLAKGDIDKINKAVAGFLVKR